jgi:hypothetical protein
MRKARCSQEDNQLLREGRSGKIFAEGTIPSTRFGSGPGALHSIFAQLPTITLQQRRNSPVSVATVLTGQGNDRFGQRIFVDIVWIAA